MHITESNRVNEELFCCVLETHTLFIVFAYAFFVLCICASSLSLLVLIMSKRVLKYHLHPLHAVEVVCSDQFRTCLYSIQLHSCV